MEAKGMKFEEHWKNAGIGVVAKGPRCSLRSRKAGEMSECSELFVAERLDYEYKAVDLLKGEQKNPEFLKINPIGCVPALVDGDVVIADSFAILMYLEEKYPQHPLLPKDLEKRAINYQKYIEEMVGPDAKLPWANKYGNKGFAALEKLLEKHAGKYATGDDVYLADVFLAPQVYGSILRLNLDVYLEEKYPQHPLLPKDLEKRAINYQKYIEEMVGPDAKLPWANKYGNKGFAALEKLLEKHAGKYATGDDVYLADVFLAPQVYGSILRLNLDVVWSAYLWIFHMC
ncbi:glutathione S-transferase [Artemisia annua]|uniref:Glutathione S-transferase n=1 Tax=Artemisia annua TaxID=35608 RepID=A0A2U1M5B6_ARTAN|nr:glutathione S-transferase [Artemisia annua]